MRPFFSRVLSGSKVFWGWYVLMQLLVVGAAFSVGYLFHDWSSPYSEISAWFGGDLSLLHQAQKLLVSNAYDPVPPASELEYGMIRGMVQAMNDPFTTFYAPPQAELQSNQLAGHFGGIGVRVERDDQGWVYLYPLPDSPAGAAGVHEGDRLLAVDGKPILAETSNDEVQADLRGNVDEKVKITVSRAPDFTQSSELTVKRGDVALPSVTWNLAPDEVRVGVVQVNVMADTTPQEVEKAVRDLETRGARYFILDLRNNGGGLVDSGVNTARLF